LLRTENSFVTFAPHQLPPAMDADWGKREIALLLPMR